jgi:hypothetical protein
VGRRVTLVSVATERRDCLEQQQPRLKGQFSTVFFGTPGSANTKAECLRQPHRSRLRPNRSFGFSTIPDVSWRGYGSTISGPLDQVRNAAF